MNDAILHHLLQFLLRYTERWLHLVKRMHEIRSRYLDVIDILKRCNGADLRSAMP